MAYDSVRHVTVLFGGSPPGAPGQMNDTWEWDGFNWTQRFPQFSPSPRLSYSMAFDAIRGRTVLVGGTTHAANSSIGAEVYEWDGTNWTVRSLAPGGSSPSPRSGAPMSYDAIGHRVVLFGGQVENPFQPTYNITDLADTWAWDGTSWTQIATASAPSPRAWA